MAERQGFMYLQRCGCRRVPGRPGIPESGDRLRLMAMGRVGPEKNAINLIRGLALFHRELGLLRRSAGLASGKEDAAGQRYCERLDALLEKSPEVRKRWRWLGAETNVPGLLREHHALIHPSLYEGLPNVVCEALAAGMPVLVSNVCDHPCLVADGERGFLFDPVEPRSIAAAIESLVDLSAADWCKFSHNARRYAEENLDVEKMITNYEALFTRLLPHRTDMNGASREDCP